jgi:uncharacterized protein (DUF1499 family)
MAKDSFPALGAPRWPSTLTRIGLWAIGIGLLCTVIAGPLNRFGVTNFRIALLVLAAGLLVLVVGALLAIVGFLVALAKGSRVPRGVAAVAIVAALAMLGYLLTWLRAGMGVPPIHEISTDLAAPPPFVAVKAIRDAIPGLNPVDYVVEIPGNGGAKTNVPDAQRKAYPDIQPLLLDGVAPADAFARVESAARALGWEIVASVPAEGRLEATDTTLFFGFKDDVVVRLRAEGGGTRIDVRSKSRVGLGDAGTNAKRVRALLERVKAAA